MSSKEMFMSSEMGCMVAWLMFTHDDKKKRQKTHHCHQVRTDP